MSYKKLQNLRYIFNRADYDYLSDNNKIKILRLRLEYNLYSPTSLDSVYKSDIKDYLNALESFCGWLNSAPITAGSAFCKEQLQEILKLFEQSTEVRILLASRGKKLFKNLCTGLSIILDGVRLSFDPNNIGSTNITEDQIIKYIQDGNEGLGRKYRFNTAGKYAFANKISQLSKQELIVTMRLLMRPSGNQIRTINKWKDLGIGGSIIRILVEPHTFKKDKAFYLFRLNEHDAYQHHLQFFPDRCTFQD